MVTRWMGAVVLVALFAGRGSRESVLASDPTAAATPGPGSSVAVANAMTRWSTKRFFEVSYISSPTPVPLLQVHSWTISITDATGHAVNDARITVLGGMPAHAHGLPTTPQVQSLGGGRYLIEGLKFHMPGAWVVALRIKAGALIDSVTFDLQLD